MKVLLTTSMQIKSVYYYYYYYIAFTAVCSLTDKTMEDTPNSVVLLQTMTINGTTDGKLLSERHPKDFMFSFLDMSNILTVQTHRPKSRCTFKFGFSQNPTNAKLKQSKTIALAYLSCSQILNIFIGWHTT